MRAASEREAGAPTRCYGSVRGAGGRAALAPSSAPVDARDLPQLMCMVSQFASLFSFTALDGGRDGDWRDFFAHDLGFVLAQALSFDVRRESDKVEVIVHSVADPKQRDVRILARLFQLQKEISEWTVAVRDISAPSHLGTPASLVLEQLIESRLAPLLQPLSAHPHHAALLKRLQRQYVAARPADGAWLDRLWTCPPHRRLQRSAAAADPHAVFQALAGLIEGVKVPLRACFDAALEQRFGHAPHTALMAAFLQLLRHARADANAFTARHLDFYFRQVLRLGERGATPGCALLSFRVLPGAAPALVPAATPLKGGTPAGGQPLLFAVDAAQTVYHDTIAALKSVRAVAGAPLWKDGPAAIARIAAAPQADSADGRGAPLADPALGWAPFGGAGADDAADGAIGVLLTTPTLLLKGGRRMLRVRFQYAPRADASQVTFAAVTQAYNDAVTEAMGPVPGRSHDALAAQAMAEACEVWLTTAAGWRRAARFTMRASLDGAWIELLLVLPAAFPPVVAGPPAPAEAGGASPWPRLKIVLRAAARVCPYSYLQQLELQGVRLRALVRGLAPAQLLAGQRVLPAGQPFFPFGAAPALGASLEVRDPELSGKAIVRAAVTLSWHNLPSEPDGLALRYAGYATPAIENRSFQAQFEVLRQARWSSAGAARPLFTGRDEKGAPLQPVLWQPLAPLQDGDQPWEALRMRLTAPVGAFGQDLYPHLLVMATLNAAGTLGADAAAAAAAAATGTTLPPPAPPFIPQAPLVPQAGQLTLSYVATELLQAERDGAGANGAQACYYQLGPFGYRPCAPRGATLAEGLQRGGQLYIGLRDVAPGQPLALLFGMCGTARQQDAMRRDWPATTGAAALPAVDWYYLHDNAWQRFAANALLSDGTEGLSGSGIVRLQTSETGLRKDNTLMPAGLYWIAAVVDQPDAHGNITLVDTQGASATQVLAGPATRAAPALPPNSIAGFASKPAGIQSVLQALPTRRGVMAEPAADFQLRVSQRLRHKQRAVSALDFEQLVLGAFPEVFQAKCLSAAGSQAACHLSTPTPPGSIALVLVPQPAAPGGHGQAPGMPVAQLLEIRTWLLAHASAALRDLQVFSPQYEQVKVCVQLVLDPHADPLQTRRQLNDAISAWIAPWRGGATALPLGGDGRGVHHLVALLAGWNGVQQVLALDVLHSYRLDGRNQARWLGEGGALAPATPWSVLAPAAQHFISTGAQAYGLGQLAVGLDVMSFGARPAPPGDAAPTEPAAPRAARRPLRLPLARLPHVQ